MRHLIIPGIISIFLFACSNPSRQNKGRTSSSDSGSSTAAAGSPGNTQPARNNAAQGGTDTVWASLFDGKTLNGWHSYGSDAPGGAWEVESSTIHLKHGEKDGYQTKGGGDLVSNDTFENFDLLITWKVAAKSNSGILFDVQDDKKQYPETWNTGPEIQVLDITGNEDAHSPKHQAGDLYDLVACKSHTAMPPGFWNETEIICNNGNLDIIINRVNVLTTTLWNDNWKKLIAGSKFKTMPGFGVFKSGHFALQDHGGEVWYKDIKVKRL
ncbi:MAG TPA: DUF1080 domain-containing protein [Chitinophagaceae bacterium]|nr:DUF1080 domain-containing protein [Chitinophagaceae bacterium]